MTRRISTYQALIKLLKEGRINQMQYTRKQLAISLFACPMLSVLSLSSSALANELNWSVGLDNEVVYQDIYSDEQKQTLNSTNFIIRPRLSLNYESKRASGFWSASHNHVRRSLEDADVTNNYTNYAYGGSFAAIKNLLTFTANGALDYQSTVPNGFLVDSFLLNAENLSKIRSNQFGANFNLPRGHYFGHSSKINYSITESEERENSSLQLDSNVLSITTQTVTGKNFERFNAQIQSNFSVSDRSENGDYTNRQLNGEMSYRVYSNLGVLVNASHEGNQVDSQNNTFSQARQFNRAGAGLIWRESDTKQIALTWNTANNASIEDEDEDGDEDEDNKGFIGLNADWQFTPRTQLSAGYSRRFYGDSGNFSFNHRIKRFRTQIEYTEEVTSFSRLIANPENLGVFICADGITDLSACFQPNSLNYQLQANEQFIQFSSLNAEINDELILRKALTWQMGTELRRTKVSLNGRYASNDYLESDRLSRTYSAGSSVSFDIGQKTNLSWTTDYALTDEIVEGQRGESEVMTTKFSVKRSIGRYFRLSLDFSYLQRDTEGLVSGGLGNSGGLSGDIKDRSISLNLMYTLSK